ncbi:MAG: DUF1343 domain-containing protein [Bacteroidota bacterium]
MRNFAKNPQLIALCLGFFLSFGLQSCKDAPDSASQQALTTDETVAIDEQNSREIHPVLGEGEVVITGPEQLIMEYLPLMQGRKIGLVANHTSLVFNGKHLVDTLVGSGIELVRVFAPEHGFRGTADAGQAVKSGIDTETGLPIVSLYGKQKKPLPEHLKDLDVILFDIQDIGSRHYTYISTMAYVMEACAENQKPFWILDRPNPNGWYVDGPMMEEGNESFIGMHKIPIVHGMTIGEYATMINEEGWLTNGIKADINVIPSYGYTHAMRWEQTGLGWVPPSPNIATEYAAYLYPALCWLEPTPVSIGRGTDSAFIIVGAPWYQAGATARTESGTHSFFGLEMKLIDFTPRSLPGKSTRPKFEDEQCSGGIFTNRVDGKTLFLAGIHLFKDLYQQHQESGTSESFFMKRFSRWPGNTTFRQQIESDMSAEDIYQSWQEETDKFRQIRSKYLLYPEQ